MVETENSTHRVEVVPVVLEKHPNADSLSVVHVFGYPVVVRTADWVGRSVGAYIPPDSLVPVTRPEFAFLADKANAEGYARIKAIKLRGVQSFGMLVPAPERGWDVVPCPTGSNVADILGVKHYEPPMKGFGGFKGVNLGGDCSPAPEGVHTNRYDIEAGRRYADKVFVPGEPVCITEKIHGANTRIVYAGGKMHVGSRTRWLKEYPDYSHVTHDFLASRGMDDEAKRQAVIDKVSAKTGGRCEWYKLLDKHSELVNFCQHFPGAVVYGEMYGCVQDLTYGHKDGDTSFAAFDVLDGGRFWYANVARYKLAAYDVPQVPLIEAAKPYNFDVVCALAEGQSLVKGADHVREGVVVKPTFERHDDTIGRAILKWVGAGYLGRKD